MGQVETTIKSVTESQAQADKGQITQETLQKQVAQAKESVAQAAAQGAEDPYVQNSVARFHQALAYGGADASASDAREAQAAADQAVALAQAQKNPEALTLALRTRSVGKYYGGDYPGATADAKEILKVNPKDPVAATVLAAIGGHAKPVGLLPGTAGDLSGVRHHPGPLPLAGEGEKSSARSAREWLERQQKNPTEAGRLVAQSISKLKTGDLNAALRLAQQAAAADPSDPMVWGQSALVKYQLGDFSGVVADASRFESIGWKWAPVLDIRAKAQIHAARSLGSRREGRIYYQKAMEDADAALRAAPDYASAFRTRGWAKLGLGASPEDILKDFEQAASIAPQYNGDLKMMREMLKEGREEEAAAKITEKEFGEYAPRPNNTPHPALSHFGGEGGDKIIAISAGAAFLIIGLLSFALFRSSNRPITVVAGTQVPIGDWQGQQPLDPGLRRGDGGSGLRRGDERPVRGDVTSTPSIIGNRYRLGQLLGQGGMGMVFEGQDTNLGRKVAIKIPTESLDLQAVARIEKEGRLVLGLGHHPNIVTLYDIIREGGRIYLVFELVTGKTLTQILGEHPYRRMPPADAARIVGQVAAGLDHSHARHILHRDLKPSNIMIDHEGTAKVMDFGVAREIKDSLGAVTGTVIGTPIYMSPEMDDGKVLKESDLYALALTAYEMLAGVLPFSGVGQFNHKREGKFLPITEFVPKLPKVADMLFARALHPDPAQRFHSAAEFAKALADIAA